eukprot:1159081-Pelagomonas_calceolata.AAC.7
MHILTHARAHQDAHAYTSTLTQIRARAFDVIFNLTLHSALLEPSDHAAAHSDGGEEQHSGEQQQDHHHDQPQQPQQQQGQAEEDGLPPVQDQSTKHGQMMCWLRALCMQLLADVTEVRVDV